MLLFTSTSVRAATIEGRFPWVPNRTPRLLVARMRVAPYSLTGNWRDRTAGRKGSICGRLFNPAPGIREISPREGRHRLTVKCIQRECEMLSLPPALSIHQITLLIQKAWISSAPRSW